MSLRLPARGHSRARRALVGALCLLVAASCVDAPSGPDGGAGPGPLVLAPVFSLVAPGGERPQTAGQQDALAAAFDRVDRFRMVVRRAADNTVVLDTVIAVTPGGDEYDLTVPVPARNDEQFLVTLTALQGTTELFRAENIPARATPAGVAGGPAPTPLQIPLVYSGPGATATSVTVGPPQVVLAPGGSAAVGASVRDAAGSVVAGVPLSWASSAPGVASVSASGAVSALADGLATVTATTPTGLAASATVYVVAGELAYVEAGALRVRGPAAGSPVERAAGGASQPAWSPDGARLFYVLGGQVWRAGGSALTTGAWPSVSPDGTKLAVERSGQVWFTNDDGSSAVQALAGTSPLWADGSSLLVGGGSVQRVRADGSGRTTVVEGAASLPALAGDGRIASVAGGELRVTGVARVLQTGVTGRPSWSPNGRWLVAPTASGLVLVPADASAPGVALPGLGAAGEPSFRPTGALAPVPSVRVTGLSPEPPIPGTQVQVLGSGFDWIIRTNNRVVWPTRDGTVETAVGAVTEGSITTTMPRNVVAGQVRVETRSGSGLLTFVPTVGSLEVTARTLWGTGLAGVGVALSGGPSAPLSGVTDASGSLTLPGIVPGAYTATLTPPSGWVLEGASVRSLTLTAEAFALALQLTPIVASVALSPAEPALAVGATLPVTLVVTGADGQPIPQVAGLAWRSLAPELTVTPGAGLSATLGAIFPGEAAGSSGLEVSFGGRTYTFPVSVTSSISGTVTRETGASPAPPAPDVTVQVRRGGAAVAEARTGPDGRYAVSGLFRGTYDVVPAAQADLLPVPAGQSVILDQVNPSGRADFKMQSFGGVEISARTPWNTPVAGVLVRILASGGATVASGETNAEGRLSLARVTPGSYTLTITAPAGFELTGSASRPFTLTGPQSIALVVEPLVQSLRTVPEVLALEVGTPLPVQILPLDARGGIIPAVRSVTWIGGRGLDAGGVLLEGTIAARWASPDGGALELRFEVNGRVFSLPVSATTTITGTILKDPPPAPAGGASGVEAAPLPAQDVSITLKRGGAVVREVRTNEGGAYVIGGLFQGTYEVVPSAQADLSPIPASRTVVLDETNPSGRGDFQMSRGAVDSILVTVAPDSLRSLGATTTVSVAAFDTAGAPMAGRVPTFTSTNPAVASVNTSGSVTALANGTTWIRVTVESRTDSVHVTVDQRATSLVLKDPKTGLAADSIQGFALDSVAVQYEARDANANLIPPSHRAPTFASSNAGVATVGVSTGKVDLVSVGTADVTGTIDGVTDVLKFKVLGATGGDLMITTTGDIAAVAAALIGKVNGSLYIQSTALTNVDGLGSILEVTGSVIIQDNASLANVDGLANLRHVGGAVTFVTNPLLASTNIFPALTNLSYDLFVDAGARIFGMPALESLDGSLIVGGYITPGNTVLQELRFPALWTVGTVAVYGNHALTTVDLSALEETTEADSDDAPPAPVSGRVFTPGIPDPDRLLALRAAQHRAMESARDERRTERRDAAEAAHRASDRDRRGERREAPVVRGLEPDLPGPGVSERQRARLARRAERAASRPERPTAPRPARPGRPPEPMREYASFGELEFYDNPLMTSPAFPALEYVSGDLYFYANNTVTALSFPALTEVGGDFDVYYMPDLATLSAPVLADIGYGLEVSGNPDLGVLVLPALATIGSDLYASENSSMTQLKLPVLAWVGDEIEIYDHDALSVIELATGSSLEVGYDLWIEYNNALTSVQIPGLVSTGDDLSIEYNTINGSVVIGSLAPLSVGYDLDLYDNEGSFTFSAPKLVSVYDDLDIAYNSGLTSVSVATTGGPLTVGYYFEVWGNPALTALNPGSFTNGYYLEVSDNPALAALSFPALASLSDGLDIDGNAGLTSVSFAALTYASDIYMEGVGTTGTPVAVSFPVLATVASWVNVMGYDGGGITSLSMPALTRAGGVFLGAMPNLASINFASLARVDYDLQIYEMPALSTFSFPALVWADFLEVAENPGVTSFSFPALTGTGDTFAVYQNPLLTSFSAPALASAAAPPPGSPPRPDGPDASPTPITDGYVEVWQNAALTGFDLSNLASARDVEIDDNDALVNLPALPDLAAGVSLWVNGNAALANLTGLAGVTQLYRLEVYSNPALASVAGLGALQQASRIYFRSNDALTSVSFPALTQIWQHLEIRDGTYTTISAPSLTTVGAGTGPTAGVNLYLVNNPALTSLAFPSLATLDGYVVIESTGLTNLNAFSALRSPIFQLLVQVNPALTNISGLSGIGTTSASPAVAGSFTVQLNPQLCTEHVASVIATIQARGAGAFASPPANSGNKTDCGT